MKFRKVFALVTITCTMFFSACGNAPTRNAEDRIQLKLDSNEITVEVSETFVIKATSMGDDYYSGDNIRWHWVENFRSIRYNNSENFDPDKGTYLNSITDRNPYGGTEFIALEPGIVELWVVDDEGNQISDTCIVTVVEENASDDIVEDKEYEDAVNNGSISLYSADGTTILLKNNLPSTINYVPGEIGSSCKITKVSLDQKTSMGVRFDVECEKTYEQYNGCPVVFNWKLYDSSDMVVETGTIKNNGVEVGDRFRESFIIYEELEPDIYTIKFVDFN